jgi:hypothetical protein
MLWLFSSLCCLPLPLWILLGLSFFPTAAALSEFSQFPELTFLSFSQFIQKNFPADISLSTVLLLLFTMTENPDLLSLHARQQYSLTKGENISAINSWIKSLSRAVHAKVNNSTSLLHESDRYEGISENHIVSNIATKLDGLARHLGLIKYNKKGHLKTGLKPISYTEIEAVHIICPQSYQCVTSGCGFRSLVQTTKQRDIPLVTLVKNNTIHKDVPVLTGRCPNCMTSYSADHERTPEINEENRFTNLYLNSAKFLKVGQSVWVDRVFSNAVVNAMYSFHASASSYMEFWNNSFGKTQQHGFHRLSRRQIWQAFVQESIRTIAASADTELSVRDNLAIGEITKEAFSILGENGVIRAADQHACSECTHNYIATTADTTPTALSAAVVGVDEVEPSSPQPANSSSSSSSGSTSASTSDDGMDIDKAPVKMVVVDGTCFGPKHCAYENCSDDLINYRGAVFCAIHEQAHGAKCRVHNCDNEKIRATQACQQHQPQWKKYIAQHKRQSAPGFRRITQRPAENLPWISRNEQTEQPHDEPMEETEHKNYFSAPSFYCVETICAPCGVVVAWAKFPKAESPTNILAFLEKVFHTEESRPDYICIDKACLVLRTALRNGSWERAWEMTTRFIVDAYHYINHRDDDELCKKWCNPAPADGSAPNLVVEAIDKQGKPCFRRAFNTQASFDTCFM